ncbi:hypothetical protein N7535_004661 [Penicillium sp. DV-2018c]|nr:hypothetical protein N7461_008241 [Penicillium sp. DV-2018c]KAJ5571001.1 hypothetical protein N7535_004661 [Penicillium sp. DV-2018c]
MVNLKRFSELPPELKLLIWEFAVPARIVEVAEPSDPDINTKDLRRAWLLNCKVPATAHVCSDSRKFTTAKLDLGDCQVDWLDPRWLWKSTEVIHFNCPDQSSYDSNGKREIQERLRDLGVASLLGKKVSLSADLLHPFMRFHHCPIPRRVWELLATLDSCIISIGTILIRASKEQARARGLFGDGEEPVELIDPFDDALINQYKSLWKDTEHSPETTDTAALLLFDFICIDRISFRDRTERWLAEVADKYLFYRSFESTFPLLRAVVAKLTRRPSAVHDPEVQALLEGMPVMDLRIMFRLCPPLTNSGWH